MEQFWVRKEFTFDAAHRLVAGYKGKCAHVHGHTFRVRVEIASGKLDAFGFVRDFSEFKVLKDWVDANLDHATLVSVEDRGLLSWLTSYEQRYFVVKGNPTSENLAKLLFDKGHELGLPLNMVEVDETCTSTARYARPW